MDVTINIVELSSNLAAKATFDEMVSSNLISDEEEMFAKVENEEMTIYTEAAQEIFNRHYDYFYDEIESCKA